MGPKCTSQLPLIPPTKRQISQPRGTLQWFSQKHETVSILSLSLCHCQDVVGAQLSTPLSSLHQMLALYRGGLDSNMKQKKNGDPNGGYFLTRLTSV